jgi:NAD(P)-dependent dehydrogenase (short-subunit alcohol dehydrogenase family)
MRHFFRRKRFLIAARFHLPFQNRRKKPYDKWAAYGQSKSANSLFAVELDKRRQRHGIRAFAAHPGGILTDLGRYMTEEDFAAFGIYRENGVLKGPEWLKTIEQGAATTVWCAVSPQLNNKGGVYWRRLRHRGDCPRR